MTTEHGPTKLCKQWGNQLSRSMIMHLRMIVIMQLQHDQGGPMQTGCSSHHHAVAALSGHALAA